MTTRLLVALCGVLVLILMTSGAAAPALANRVHLVDGCAPGSGYDPACDLNFDGAIDILDMQLAAGHWGQGGVHTGRAPVPKTGVGSIAGYTPVAGEDILLQRGIAWPIPRFTDNHNGSVTDNLTGLIWLKDADCFGLRQGLDAQGARPGGHSCPARRHLFPSRPAQLAHLISRGAVDDLKQLPYTLQVVKEALRLYAAAPIYARDVVADDTLDGVHIAAGS